MSQHQSFSERVKEQLLGETFQRVYHIFCRIVFLTTFLAQFAFLDVYLVYYNNNLWCLWIIPDLLVFLAFLATAVISYRHLRLRSAPKKQSKGEIPTSYLTWFFYSVILSAKFCIIYALPHNDKQLLSIAKELDEKNFFGPNMLQTSLSLTSIVLYVFVLSLHDTKSHSDPNNFIQTIVGSAYVDLLDAVSFSGILLKDADVIKSYHLDRVTLAIVSFNFILPTGPLFLLSRSYFGKFPFSRKAQLIHKIAHFIVVNLPMFLVRMVVWHLHEQSVSVFLVKNVLALGLAVKDIHDFTLEVAKVITDSPDGDPDDAEKGAKPEDIELEVKGNQSEMQVLREAKT